MTDSVQIPDAAERARALDPAQSFIVQAPAGSGKTTLLIQRYLKLLMCVDAPEEIVAITFTRKAAAEMRTRVLAALEIGSEPVAGETAQQKLQRELAIAVLQRNRQAGWHIAENPERLRIQTIDSLCAALTRQMPILSEFGAQPETIEDAADYYLEAARATLVSVEQNHAMARDVERLLEHLDNDMARIEVLLADMLARRDHWLRHLHGKPREELELSLQNSRNNALQFAFRLFPMELHDELLALLRYATDNLINSGKSSAITLCNSWDALLATDVGQWQGIAELLLTRKGDWRKRASEKEGFPAGSSKTEKDEATAWKNRLKTLLELLAPHETLRQALYDMRQLPPPHYSDRQWDILGAITRLLPYVVAQLNVIFQIHGKVDFAEVAQRALRALGDFESPTDLALALDYRIKHLMIDEFQDISISQFSLIEKLVASWEVGDGRSFFAVGDPMQSIYRFREAEVGLFLQARNTGIGALVLQPLTLSANFRSQLGIIDWVNTTFARIMPDCEDSATGAVTYTASIATHAGLAGEAVKIYPSLEKNELAEARQVVEIILRARDDHPGGTIAILVRNRSHLIGIVEQIKAAGLRFRAIDIELLRHKPVVQDLLALTRAVINPADDVAWFALLRAPWCGLLLKDITVLVENNPAVLNKDITVWALIGDESRWQGISTDAMGRLRRIREVLSFCMRNRQRQTLRVTVEAVWHALGGAGCMSPIANGNADAVNYLRDAMIFLDYLENQEMASDIQDLTSFEKGLAALYASPDLEADESLQIMTIHKAKGLEFDTVIVPGLGRGSRNHDKQLLRWIEQPHSQTVRKNEAVVPDLLLAPIQETGAEIDPIYSWVEKLDRDKAQFETDRLLYVAATRAKKFLHLLGHVNAVSSEHEDVPSLKPMQGSLLHRLWVAVQPAYGAAAADAVISMNHESEQSENEEINSIDGVVNNQCIYRLESDWVLPDAPESVIWQELREKKPIREAIEFSWASEMARHVGNVVHRWLQKIAEDKMHSWDNVRIQEMRKQFAQNLVASGMSGDDQALVYAVERIALALTNAISDERGRWILGVQQFAQNELKISGIVNNKVMNWIIDRTFCDANGIRWIIDYKTSSHEGSALADFLDREKMRYQHQLEHYAELMRQIDTRHTIKLGIYFPLMRGWREW